MMKTNARFMRSPINGIDSGGYERYLTQFGKDAELEIPREHNAAFGRNQFGMKWVVNWVKVMLRHKHANPGQPMNKFLLRFGAKVSGILSGFDRLRFRGSNRSLCHASGILAFLCWAKILLKDFGDYAEGRTTTLCTAIEKRAVELDTPTI